MIPPSHESKWPGRFPDWEVEVSFAKNGAEGVEALKAGKGDILFLDLNMPVMDGYEVLAEIAKKDLPTMAIVVSGDIQPEANERVRKMGAIAFIKKPVDGTEVIKILTDYGLYRPTEDSHSGPSSVDEKTLSLAGSPISVTAFKKSATLRWVRREINLPDCWMYLSNCPFPRSTFWKSLNCKWRWQSRRGGYFLGGLSGIYRLRYRWGGLGYF